MLRDRIPVDLLMPSNCKNYGWFIYFIPNFMQCVKTSLNPMTMKLMHARQQQKNRASAALCSSVSFCLAHTVYYLFVCLRKSWLRVHTWLLHSLCHCSYWKIKKETLHVQFFFSPFFPSWDNLTMTFTDTFCAETSLNCQELLKSARSVYSLWLGQ